MLRSNLCDFGDAYIVVKGDITLEGDNDANKHNKNLALIFYKDNALFMKFISKTNNIKIDNAEDLDVVMSMYNLLEYSKNYKKTTGSLWSYCRDGPSNPLSTNSESFKHKTSILGKSLQKNDSLTNSEVVIPLKRLNNFWRSLDIPLINCEVEITLTSTKNCVLADMTTRDAGNNNDLPAIVAPSGATFKITDTKLYVPVVTLSKENVIKLLEQLKTGFKKTIKCNKYQSQMSIQDNNNNLNYLIDPTFTDINRLFVLLFERIEKNNVKKDYRDFYSHYYVPTVQIKDFNVLIDGKSFFNLPVKK